MRNSKILFLFAVILIFGVNFLTDYINPYYFQILIYAGINIILATEFKFNQWIHRAIFIGHAGFMAIGAYVSVSVSTYFAPNIISIVGDNAFGHIIWFLIVLLIRWIRSFNYWIGSRCSFAKTKRRLSCYCNFGFGEIIRVTIQNLNVIGASQGFRGVYVYQNGVKSLRNGSGIE